MSKLPSTGIINFSDLSNIGRFATPSYSFQDLRSYTRNGVPSTGIISLSMFRNQCAVGLYESAPGASASDILSLQGALSNGVYYIDCAGASKPTFCLMNSAYDGGGWMLLMKMNNGATFGFDADYWTTSNVLNDTDITRAAADAKYDVFNHKPIKDVMAIWPAADIAGTTGGSFTVPDGWVWNHPNWYNSGSRINALAGFQITRDASPLNPQSFSGFSTSAPMWSYQTGTRLHGFVGSHFPSIPTSIRARWGWFWNNEINTLSSMDCIAGIGVKYYDNPSSAGDFWSWSGVNKQGYNRSIRCELYGR